MVRAPDLVSLIGGIELSQLLIVLGPSVDIPSEPFSEPLQLDLGLLEGELAHTFIDVDNPAAQFLPELMHLVLILEGQLHELPELVDGF